MNKAWVMKRAWEIKKEDSRYIFGLCLKMAWKEAREMSEEIRIETTYYGYGSRTNGYKDEILEGHLLADGNLEFDYPETKEWSEPTAKTNKTQRVTLVITTGIYAVNGRIHGVDLDKVKQISGKTYSLRVAAKEAGMRWNGKVWAR